MSTGTDVLGARGYEQLRRAAETHREDLVVRLGAEVGLRPTEMARVRVADITTAGNHHFLAVRDGETVTREAYLPSDVEHDVRKFASAAGRDDDEPLLSVSARRLQMLVGEVADRETVVRAVDAAETDGTPARLRRTIGVASEVGAALSEAATGEEIAETVCDRLAATEGFRFAWVAEHTGDGLTPRAMAGVSEHRVTEQRRVHADVAADAMDGNDVRPVQGANGPVMFVPVTREDAVSGVLAVGTTARVGDTEREVLKALGTHIGAALSAVERKRLLLADTVTELTFQCSDDDAVT